MDHLCVISYFLLSSNRDHHGLQAKIQPRRDLCIYLS